jgi:hypothetical protein
MSGVPSVLNAIFKLSKPMQEKALKALGLSTKGLPGRSSKNAGIVVGKDRLKVEKKIDQIKGGAKVTGVLTAGAIVNELLGIKTAADATAKPSKKPSGSKNYRPGKGTKPVSNTKSPTKKPPVPKKKPATTPKTNNKVTKIYKSGTSEPGVTFKFEKVKKIND